VDWLSDYGFGILSQNWRNRYCEIDIVAKRNNRIHFIEVKYRRSNQSGDGFAAITPKKAGRLKQACRHWLTANNTRAAGYQIDVVSVSGYPEPNNVEYLPNAITLG
jgi:putative endonuclease